MDQPIQRICGLLENIIPINWNWRTKLTGQGNKGKIISGKEAETHYLQKFKKSFSGDFILRLNKWNSCAFC